MGEAFSHALCLDAEKGNRTGLSFFTHVYVLTGRESDRENDQEGPKKPQEENKTFEEQKREERKATAERENCEPSWSVDGYSLLWKRGQQQGPKRRETRESREQKREERLGERQRVRLDHMLFGRAAETPSLSHRHWPCE